MSADQFHAIFPIVVADLVDMISTNRGFKEEDAIKSLYECGLYKLMEKEESKLWQYSTFKLYDLYLNEVSGDSLEFPDY